MARGESRAISRESILIAGLRGSPGPGILPGVAETRMKSMDRVLTEVSRSFSLSLQLLPRKMRGGTSLAYLLARASDTLADVADAEMDRRLGWLDSLTEDVRRGAANCGAWRADALAAMDGVPSSRAHDGERVLLERFDDCLGWLVRMPDAEAGAIRRVFGTIVSGQRLDVERFGEADAEKPVTLDAGELDDYTYRVAGCVGRFWTELGVVTLGEQFSAAPEEELAKLGEEFGKGLQLVNILRDVPADLAAGRCYLPVGDPGDRGALLAVHREWLARAREKMAAGERYAGMLAGVRVRLATALPAMLGRETLDLLDGVGWEELERRPKVPRSRVRRLMVEGFGRALVSSGFSGRRGFK